MNQSELDAARARAVERQSALRDKIAVGAARILEMTDDYQPSKDKPDGEMMPADLWKQYQALAQNTTIANDQLKLVDAEVGRLESMAIPTMEFNARQREALTAFAAGESMSSVQEDEFMIESSGMDAARFPSAKRQFRIRGAMTRTGAGGDTSGAAAVPEYIEENTLVESMLSFQGVANIASVMRTTHGNNVDVPNVDATSQMGVRLSEGTAAADLDMPDLGVTTLKAWIYSSMVATISHQLIRDSSFNMVEWMERSLVIRNARRLESESTTGMGAARPTGIIDQLDVGKTTADDTSFTWQEMMDLFASVDDAYLAPPGHGLGGGGEVAFIMNKPTLIKVMQLADTQNRPLYLPDINGAMGMQLFGFPIRKIYGMANIAAESKSVAFGNFGYYVQRVTDETRALRFDDSVYAKRNLTGFLVFNEADARWIQGVDANSKITCAKVMQQAAA